MKKIRLILETYRQNVVPSILVLVIMTISLLVMTVSLGQYRLSTYTLDLLAHAGLENADYFMQELSGPGSLDEAYTQQLIEKMDSYSIVAEVLKAQFAVTEYKRYAMWSCCMMHRCRQPFHCVSRAESGCRILWKVHNRFQQSLGVHRNQRQK